MLFSSLPVPVTPGHNMRVCDYRRDRKTQKRNLISPPPYYINVLLLRLLSLLRPVLGDIHLPGQEVRVSFPSGDTDSRTFLTVSSYLMKVLQCWPQKNSSPCSLRSQQDWLMQNVWVLSQTIKRGLSHNEGCSQSV